MVVGNYGTILVKQAEQDSWEIARSGYSYSLRSVIWTGERFVAVGGEYQAYGGLIKDAIVLTSEDVILRGRALGQRDVTCYDDLRARRRRE